jgi:hypothetical protein
MNTVDELEVVILTKRIKAFHYLSNWKTYGVANGPHILPECTSCPPGPQPTRNERPMDKPASKYIPS